MPGTLSIPNRFGHTAKPNVAKPPTANERGVPAADLARSKADAMAHARYPTPLDRTTDWFWSTVTFNQA